MFKKKGINSKKFDLSQETDQIIAPQRKKEIFLHDSELNLIQNEDSKSIIHNQYPKIIQKNKVRNNLFTLEGLEANQSLQTQKLNKHLFSNEEIKVENQQINNCFTQLRQIKQIDQITMRPQNQEQKIQKMSLRVQNNDFQSQPQGLEIEVDEEGGFSPQFGYGNTQQYDDINGDYEDQLIKKTLTKRNYENLSRQKGINLNFYKKNEAEDNFAQKLNKINAKTIKKLISRDLYNKKLKLSQLNTNLNEVHSYKGNKKQQMEIKEKRLLGLKQELANITQIIEYIYYWGDKITDFTVSGIQRQIKEKKQRQNQYNDEYQF